MQKKWCQKIKYCPNENRQDLLKNLSGLFGFYLIS